ncbi:MAG: HD domain-containing protein [Planctomycetota bacterium]
MNVPADALHPIIDELIQLYTSSTRHYHDLNHIRDLHQRLSEFRRNNAGEDMPWQLVELAIWFHDSVYDATRQDNEVQSAAMSRRKLSILLDEEDQNWMERAILATVDHQPNDDSAIQLLLDLDLAPLAEPYEVFEANANAIRREYAHLSESEFDQGRREFLAALLQRERLYGTPYFHDQLESAARSNIQRALSTS